MKKLLLTLIIIAFTSCSLKIDILTGDARSQTIQTVEEANADSLSEKKILKRDYDPSTENKIKISMRNIIDQLLTEDIKDQYSNIYIAEIITSRNADKKESKKFENHLRKLVKNDLDSRGIKTDRLKEISLKIRYKKFGAKGILVNGFLIDGKNKTIISSSKSIIPVNACNILNLNCIEKPRTRELAIKAEKSINNDKRTIGLVDTNSNKKKVQEQEKKVNFSLIEYE